MFVSNVLWGLHDLYRDGNVKAIRFVDKVFHGWHVLKFVMVPMFFLSGVIAGMQLHGMVWYTMICFGVALVCAKQSAFEGTYSWIEKSIKPFYWFRSWKSVLMCWDWEYLFHNCFKLHWIEAGVVFLFGLYLIWRL